MKLILMPRQLRIHKVDSTKTTPQERWEIRQFIESIFADRAHTLFIRNTPTNMLVYLRMEGKQRPRTNFRAMIRLDEMQERRWLRG
jgi:hypothetical protein